MSQQLVDGAIERTDWQSYRQYSTINCVCRCVVLLFFSSLLRFVRCEFVCSWGPCACDEIFVNANATQSVLWCFSLSLLLLLWFISLLLFIQLIRLCWYFMFRGASQLRAVVPIYCHRRIRIYGQSTVMQVFHDECHSHRTAHDLCVSTHQVSLSSALTDFTIFFASFYLLFASFASTSNRFKFTALCTIFVDDSLEFNMRSASVANTRHDDNFCFHFTHTVRPRWMQCCEYRNIWFCSVFAQFNSHSAQNECGEWTNAK